MKPLAVQSPLECRISSLCRMPTGLAHDVAAAGSPRLDRTGASHKVGTLQGTVHRRNAAVQYEGWVRLVEARIVGQETPDEDRREFLTISSIDERNRRRRS